MAEADARALEPAHADDSVRQGKGKGVKGKGEERALCSFPLDPFPFPLFFILCFLFKQFFRLQQILPVNFINDRITQLH
jgi:hypothetical protein